MAQMYTPGNPALPLSPLWPVNPGGPNGPRPGAPLMPGRPGMERVASHSAENQLGGGGTVYKYCTSYSSTVINFHNQLD